MSRYIILNSANKDLNEIWEYTFHEWSITQADKYYYSLIDCFQELADNPKLGKKYYKVEPKLLGFKFGRHIIFYEPIENNTIEINRILHESMDLKNRLKK
tara:strand:- start:166 stop:465 length:300 start_codon:yes stop_codon:yes gene_type:complete